MLARGLFAAGLLLFSAQGGSSEPFKLCEGILPDDVVAGLSIPKTSKTGITEEQFNEALDRIEELYAPYIEENFGAKFSVERLWDSSVVNAYASRSGNEWNIHMHGGLARYELMSPGGFVLVACHEVGHHLGGAPKKQSRWSVSWASSEGQSDYYGTLKCVRQVLERGGFSWSNPETDPAAAAACDGIYFNEYDREVCYAGAMMGYNLAMVLDRLSGGQAVHFTTPDPREVTTSNNNHPRAQCRLDTYFHGALCPEGHDKDISNENPAQGTCWVSEGMTDGTRRRCWFQPADFR